MVVSTNITIRSAAIPDVTKLLELSSQLGYPNEEGEIAKRLEYLLAAVDHNILVAVGPEGQVLGWIHGAIRKLLIIPTHIEIGGLVVDSNHRNQKIGERLLVAIEEWGKSILHRIWCSSGRWRSSF